MNCSNFQFDRGIIAACVIVSIIGVMPSMAGITALDDYVATSDANYSYTQVSGSYDLSTFTEGYVLQLTSQAWRDGSEVDQPVWTHWVTIVVPRLEWALGDVKDTALILVNGGDTTDPEPVIDPQFRSLAMGSRSVIIVLSGVPNQPLTFTDETTGRVEDEIIAYSWDKFLQGGDDYWPVQLPMVKSVVRCMDAVQEFVAASDGEVINDFVLTGGSKRGWTVWLTAAVDNRVSAISPIVSDLLNMKRSFAHQWAVYGFWAEALLPYEELGIFDWFDSPAVDDLMTIVDPYEYLDRLDIPKFIVNAAGDDFFVSDSIQFYIDDLPGETYLRHVPNSDHYLTDTFDDVFFSMVPYYDAFLNGDARPVFDWTLEDDGSIRVVCTDVPKAVNLWQVTNPAMRDLRLVTTGAAWTSSAIADSGGAVYVGQVPMPAQGWTAFFVELVYDSPFQGADAYDYRFTTEMRVLPEVRPFEADFNRDTFVDSFDLLILADVWLSGNVYRDISPRRGGDDIIDMGDFAIFASHWLQ